MLAADGRSAGSRVFLLWPAVICIARKGTDVGSVEGVGGFERERIVPSLAFAVVHRRTPTPRRLCQLHKSSHCDGQPFSPSRILSRYFEGEVTCWGLSRLPRQLQQCSESRGLIQRRRFGWCLIRRRIKVLLLSVNSNA